MGARYRTNFAGEDNLPEAGIEIPRSDADDASSLQNQELHLQQNMEDVATDRTDCMLVAVSCQSETYMQHLHHEFMRGMYVKFIDWTSARGHRERHQCHCDSFAEACQGGCICTLLKLQICPVSPRFTMLGIFKTLV